MGPELLQVKNWDKFQHYRDRKPPWIKLATDTFQDPTFARLQSASKLLAICIWTLASRSHNGTIVDDFDYIARWGFLTSQVSRKNLEELVDKGFVIRASNPLATCKQSARAEGEREGEGETEREAEKKRAKPARTAQAPDLPDWLPLDDWNAFVEMRRKIKAPLTPFGKSLIIGKLKKLVVAGENPVAVLDQSTMNSWRGIRPVHTGGNDNGTRYKSGKDRQRETDRQAIEYLKQQAARRAVVQGDPTNS